MRRSFSPVWAVGAVLWVLGCGGGDSEETAAGSTPAASTPDAPLRGKGVAKAGDLTGTWAATTDGDFECLEFLESGKALIGDGTAGLTVDYSVLDGGRLSLALSGGMTTVFEATIAGDALELSGKSTALFSGGTQRFRRLKSGETCEDARKARERAKAEAYEKRVAALGELLAQPKLVLAFGDGGPGAPPSIALEVSSAAGQFTGKAWHDDRPPHLNQISGRLELDPASNTARVVVAFGPRISPPSAQPDGGGTIALGVDGDGKALRVAGKVTFGGATTAYDVALRSDPKLHAEIVKRYDTELARIEALKQPLLAALEEYAVLRGRVDSADARKTEPDAVDLTLLRDPKSGQYFCEGVMIGARDRGELLTRAAAEIIIAGNSPWLRIVTPPAREYLLSLSGAGSKTLSGTWRMPGGGGTEKRAQFEIEEALDGPARDARFEAMRTAVKALGTKAVFTGLAHEDSGFGLEEPIAVELTLNVQADGSVLGTAEYPSMSTRMTVAGRIAETPVGPLLELGYTNAESTPGDQIFLRSIQRGTWRFVPVGEGDSSSLRGCFTGPPVRMAELKRANAASKARTRERLAAAFDAGGRFYLSRFVGWQTPGQVPTVVEWKLDRAALRITGQILTAGRPIGANEKVLNTYEGEIKDEGNWVAVHLTQTSHWSENNKAVTEFELLAAEDAKGVLYLTGPMVNLGQVRDGKRAIDTPPQKSYPICFVPVDSTDPETRAAIDKAIADAEKAKADAEARIEAERVAALDARRAKITPFFPIFRSGSGAVITTDAPAEMSLVLLEAAVDEANATVTGRGIDLREMPLQEITFETGLDNWGNLTVTTSPAKGPYAFANPTEAGATGRGVALAVLSPAERVKIDARIKLGKSLESAAPIDLKVETLDAAEAKAREATLAASDLPGVAIYKARRNDQVAAMFTARSNGRYRWSNEPVMLRLNEPLKGKALYIKGGGPTDGLTVVINGVHRASIASIAQLGAAIIALPPDLEVLEIRLDAGRLAQARGVVLLP